MFRLSPTKIKDQVNYTNRTPIQVVVLSEFPSTHKSLTFHMIKCFLIDLQLLLKKYFPMKLEIVEFGIVILKSKPQFNGPYAISDVNEIVGYLMFRRIKQTKKTWMERHFYIVLQIKLSFICLQFSHGDYFWKVFIWRCLCLLWPLLWAD